MSPTSPQAAGQTAVEHEIMFQNWFKSVGPRTYAAQVKKAKNGNHFVVLTEGKRDEKSGEVRKTSLFVFSEDFAAFFKMLHETAVFVREHPVPDEVKKKQDSYWARRRAEADAPAKAENPDPNRQDRRPGAHSAAATGKGSRPAPTRRPGMRQRSGAVGVPAV